MQRDVVGLAVLGIVHTGEVQTVLASRLREHFDCVGSQLDVVGDDAGSADAGVR
ncbi:hypothetical protein D3C81_1906720 [compost metagenome]